MSDVAYRPISDADEESETHATTELPVASWSDFRKELEDQHGVSHDDLTPEAATEESVRRRQEAPTAENASERPLVRLRSEGGPQTLKEASSDLSFTRGYQARDELLASGYTEQEVRQLGIDKMEAAVRGDLLAAPPDKVEFTDKWGEQESGELSASEAADKISAWRSQQAAERAAELAELTGRHEEQQAQSEQSQPEPQPEPQQPDAVQRERAQLAAERQNLALLRQMDHQEAQLHNSYQQLVARVVEDFPSLRNGPPSQADINDLREKAPARFQQLATADAALKQYQLQLRAMAQQREQRDQQQTRQRAAARERQDQAFEEKAARLIPNWEHVGPEVRQQAHRTLQDAGMSQEEIRHLWQGDHTIDAHSSVLQIVLAKAALWDSAHAKAQTIRQSGLPSVIRPGVGNSFARGNNDRVADIKARMRTAKGSAGLKLGAELVRAQRNRD